MCLYSSIENCQILKNDSEYMLRFLFNVISYFFPKNIFVICKKEFSICFNFVTYWYFDHKGIAQCMALNLYFIIVNSLVSDVC